MADIWLVLLTAGAVLGMELLLLSLYAPRFFIRKFIDWLPDILEMLETDPEAKKSMDRLLESLKETFAKIFMGYAGKMKQMMPKGQDIMMGIFGKMAEGYMKQNGLIPPDP